MRPSWVPSDYIVGMVMNLAGSITINLGTNVVKLAYTEKERRDRGRDADKLLGEKDKIFQRTWGFGVGLFAAGNVLNFISFSFAAQSLLAALGSVQFVSNVVFSAMILAQPIRKSTMFATFLIVMGNFVIASYATKASHTYTADQLFNLYFTWRYKVYMFGAGLIAAASHVVYLWARRRGLQPDDMCRIVPMSYALVSATIGSQSVLLAKSTSELLRLTAQGQDQTSHPFSLVVLLLWGASMMFWLYRMDAALQMFDSVFIVPVLQVVWTLCSIIGGGLYFNEFSDMSTSDSTMFFVGVLLVVWGVSHLALQTPKARTKSSSFSGQGVESQPRSKSVSRSLAPRSKMTRQSRRYQRRDGNQFDTESDSEEYDLMELGGGEETMRRSHSLEPLRSDWHRSDSSAAGSTEGDGKGGDGTWKAEGWGNDTGMEWGRDGRALEDGGSRSY